MERPRQFEYVDAHAHLDDEAFDGDRDAVLQRAGGVLILNAGQDPPTNRRGLLLAGRYSNLRVCLGFHPEAVVRTPHPQIEGELRFIRERRGEIVGVSEIGLDYKFEEREKQRNVFRQFLALAEELDLPVIVHSRRAAGAVLQALEGFDLKVVLHAFAGNEEEVRRALNHGYHLTFGPNLAYNQYKQKLAGIIPDKLLLTETDSPVLGPEPGTRNEPANVRSAVARLSQIRGVEEERLREIIWENAASLFKI